MDDPKGRLPDFVVVGAMKSGTTVLANLLATHPDVMVARQKGTHYFDRVYQKGPSWYMAQFIGHELLAGDATPSYMYIREAIMRMAQTLPHARLIAILREPTSRAYSHYWHERVRGRESLSFIGAIQAEKDRLSSAGLEERLRHSYVDRGRYLNQIERILEFFPRENLRVVLLEDLTTELLRSLFVFLDVKPMAVNIEVARTGSFISFRSTSLRELGKRWPHSLRRIVDRLNTRRADSYPPIGAEERAMVKDIFREDNIALGEWLGRDLSHWNT